MELPKPKSMGLKRRYGEKIVESVLFISAITSIIIMLMIFYFLFQEGVKAFAKVGIINLIMGQMWHPQSDIYGMMPLIINSLLITSMALVINICIGFPLAVYLSELAGPRKGFSEAGDRAASGSAFHSLRLSWSDYTCEVLAGELRHAYREVPHSWFDTLGIMFIPSMTTICEDALRSVPSEFKQGSIALGANKWQTIRHITIPAASSGITAAVLLNVGQIMGETMAVLLVVGNVPSIPTPFFNIFETGATFTSVIAGEMGEVSRGSLHFQALFAAGLILLLAVTILNVVADQIRARIRKKFGGY